MRFKNNRRNSEEKTSSKIMKRRKSPLINDYGLKELVTPQKKKQVFDYYVSNTKLKSTDIRKGIKNKVQTTKKTSKY